MRTHYSCAELAAMRLPGMPTTKRRWIDLVARESWPSQPRAGRGGGLEYRPSPQVAALIMATHVAPKDSSMPAFASVPALPVAPTSVVAQAFYTHPTDTTEAQRSERDARQVVEREIRRLMDESGCTQEAAMTTLLTGARAGRLASGLDGALRRARDPRGRKGDAYPSIRSLKRYLATPDKTPKKRQKDFRILPWHASAVALRQRPQGSMLTWIHDQLRAAGHLVSYDQVYRFFKDKFSQIDQLKGRYTGSQLRAHKFYQHRTAEGLAPADEVHADGWNTHFTAPHPVTGEFVTYEIWHFHDIATRYVTPPGIGLTEQFEVIAKGLENFIRAFGRCLILQTDSTKIIRGSERFTKGLQSLEERIGCTIVHPQEVGNSQANGICENFNRSWLDKHSRELATYQADGMDTLTFKRVKKLTAAMVRAAQAGDGELMMKAHADAECMGKGHVFLTADEARAWIVAKIDAYNDRPHRALKKVRGDDGKLRHQTPREALMEHIAYGWEPVEVDEDTLIDLFRPVKVCKVTRETVSPYGGMRYRNAEVLGHWNGKEVVVSYDIHDWRQVWVKTLQGELICTAEFVAATGYRAQSAYEAAEEKRAKAQIRALENKKRQVEAQRLGGQVIELPRDNLIPARDVIDIPKSHVKREELRDWREAVPEPEAAEEKRAREMTWEETKMWLYGDGKDLREEETPPEEAATR
jgi:putative transposase